MRSWKAHARGRPGMEENDWPLLDIDDACPVLDEKKLGRLSLLSNGQW